MTISEAEDIRDAYEKYSDGCCTCFQGNAPCSYCENCPSKEQYLEALEYLNEYKEED